MARVRFYAPAVATVLAVLGLLFWMSQGYDPDAPPPPMAKVCSPTSVAYECSAVTPPDLDPPGPSFDDYQMEAR